jgi:hypothetical protein
MYRVPEEFCPIMPFRYPDNNIHEFERWYADTYSPQGEGRIYLPIMWTAYYVRNGINKSTVQFSSGTPIAAYGRLQEWLHTCLDPCLKYYTIVQHDDGILNSFGTADVKVFTMNGHKDHYTESYPLPLIAEPHKGQFDNKRTFLASFIGQLTHPIRHDMKQLFERDADILFSTVKTGQKAYCDIMSRSIFALCPRGYGPTSFRIQEAIQYGAIPVYISDEFIEPYNIDFNAYGLKIRNEEIQYLKGMLKIELEQGMTNLAAKSMKYYYSYEGCKEMILKNLK